MKRERGGEGCKQSTTFKFEDLRTSTKSRFSLAFLGGQPQNPAMTSTAAKFNVSREQKEMKEVSIVHDTIPKKTVTP